MDRRCFRNDGPIYIHKSDLLWIGVDSESGKPACFTTATFRANKLSIIRMGVLPAYRGQGLQARMLKAVLREARKLGASEVRAVVASWNVHSMNNFIRAGFQTWAPSRNRYARFVHWKVVL
jgi:GNAT superfamily N-acetyltransferase